VLKSNRKQVEAELKRQLQRRNEAAGIMVESAAKRLAPVDTGRLRASITHDSDEDGAVVGTNVEYAPMQELGTSTQPGTPFLVPGLLGSKALLRQIYGS
jgi:HK97 gp10 family phage protein